MPASGNISPALASFIEEVADHLEAPRWARDCGWVPGTGHCRSRPCEPACLFRRRREDEAASVRRSRQERRSYHRRFVKRMLLRNLPFLCLTCVALLSEII